MCPPKSSIDLYKSVRLSVTIFWFLKGGSALLLDSGLFCYLRLQATVSEPYDNPFWKKSKEGRKNRKEKNIFKSGQYFLPLVHTLCLDQDKMFFSPPPPHVRQQIFAGVDGGLRGGSSVRRSGSEEPHWHQRNYIKKEPRSNVWRKIIALIHYSFLDLGSKNIHPSTKYTTKFI